MRFAFLTGVSKFSKVSLVSGLHNLEDISLNPDFGNICGYTQLDLGTTFAPYLEGVDMEQVKWWYNGYNFLGDKVYNPYDILLDLLEAGDVGSLEPVIKRLFASFGVCIIAEDVSNKGRIDLTLKTGGRTFLFEFKVTDGEPLEQIRTMKYDEKYAGERYLIGIVFDPKARNVSKFEWEKL